MSRAVGDPKWVPEAGNGPTGVLNKDGAVEGVGERGTNLYALGEQCGDRTL